MESAEAIAASLTELLFGSSQDTLENSAHLWRQLGFHDPEAAESLVLKIAEDPFDRDPLQDLMPALLTSGSRMGAPDRLFCNFGRFVSAHGSPRFVMSILLAAKPVRELLFRLWSYSESLSDVLVRNPGHLEWLMTDASIENTRLRDEFDAEFFAALNLSKDDPARILDGIRRTHRRELLRIGIRDLLDLAPLSEILREISWLADVVVESVLRLHYESLVRQFGTPRAEDDPHGPEVGFCVMGMGKLGGEELNYSSDIDLMFVYSREGYVWRTDGDQATRGLTNHEFFSRLGKKLVQSLTEWGREGFLYRVDLRLRPEGDTGPLVRSLESYENYYASHGETWERMALIKMRPIAGNHPVGNALIETVRPFVFPRHLGTEILEEISVIKGRIEREVVRSGSLKSNLKLGRGGIRDIEFIAQSAQVLQGGQNPGLQNRRTVDVLREMGRLQIMDEQEVRDLVASYEFLRRLEHRVQMDHHLQTHTLPSDPAVLERIARSLDIPDRTAMLEQLEERMVRVRSLYEVAIVKNGSSGAGNTRHEQMVQSIIDRLATGDEAGAFSQVRDLGWPEESDGLPEALPIIRRLALGAEFTHSGARTLRLARQLLDHLFHHLPEMGRPLRVFTQMDRFVGAYGARSLLLESLTSNPRALDLLWHVFEGSRVLGEEIIMNPGLFDEVVSGAGLEEEIDSDRLIDAVMGLNSLEEGWNVLRRIKRGERFRLGLRYLESIDAEEALLNQFSALADAVVEAGLRLLASQVLLPEGLEFHILAFGKWGGGEIGFGGDLDLVYLGEGPDPVFLQRLAARFGRQMELHSATGRLFELDPRLRPYGSDGPLVTSREALLQYFERDARNWERLAWTRARRVAGTCQWDGGQAGFEHFRRNCIRSSGWSEDWLQEIMEMRDRIARERLKGERPSVMDFKSGEGGLLDVEFLGQLATVRNACIANESEQDPLPTGTLEMLDLAEADGWFSEHDDAEFARRHYRNLRRYEQLMRIWDERSHSAFPSEEEDLRSLALHMGFKTSQELIERHQADCARCRGIFLGAMVKQGM